MRPLACVVAGGLAPDPGPARDAADAADAPAIGAREMPEAAGVAAPLDAGDALVTDGARGAVESAAARETPLAAAPDDAWPACVLSRGKGSLPTWCPPILFLSAKTA